jgi:hypothetical protein
MVSAEQEDAAAEQGGDETARTGGYFQELHVALIVSLVVISIVLGIVGWQLHPSSKGFQTLPHNVRVLVAGSGYSAIETLTQSGENGATMKVTATSSTGSFPLDDSGFYSEGGPQGGGAVAIDPGPAVSLDGKPLPAARWAYIVLDPGSAQPCTAHAGYRVGLVAYPGLSPTPAVVVPPLPPEATDGDTLLPPGLCIHWDSGSPFSLSGPYLRARFPPLRGISSAVPFTPQEQQVGDLGVSTVRRTLNLDDDTASFALQSEPLPTLPETTSWTWTNKDTPQVIEVAATNLSAIQHESDNAFYSGVLFGVVGGALIALITELVVPLHPRRRRHH